MSLKARTLFQALPAYAARGFVILAVTAIAAGESFAQAPMPSLPVAPSAQPGAVRPLPPGGSAGAYRGPQSLADLAEGLLDAVVNISTSQNVKDENGGPAPQVPEGSPFQEFFDDFYKNRGSDNGRHKVNSLGSGFVIDPTGYIVTNNHVIENADDIEAVFPDGSKLKARLIGTDTKTDLSVLKVEPPQPLRAVSFGDSRRMRIGDWVMAIGNPFGLGGSVTLGIISARGRNINAGPYDNFIQTDAAINKGNSGGPLFNMEGQVIGINTAIISPSGGSIGIGFSVPTELAENVIRQLIEFGETRRGWLGVRIQPITDDLAKSIGLPSTKGALVSGVIKGGPVENGPIVAGDVIVKFDGKLVNDSRDLQRIVAESRIGAPLDVVVMRGGKEETLKVTLTRLEDQDMAQAQPAAAEGQAPAQPKPGPQATPPATGEAPAAGPARNAMLGLALAPLDDERRKQYSIVESVEGVVVTEVTPGSRGADKGLKVGEVIVEVAQEFMRSPQDIERVLTKLKSDGRRSAHMMIASATGDLRFVAIPLE